MTKDKYIVYPKLWKIKVKGSDALEYSFYQIQRSSVFDFAYCCVGSAFALYHDMPFGL